MLMHISSTCVFKLGPTLLVCTFHRVDTHISTVQPAMVQIAQGRPHDMNTPIALLHRVSRTCAWQVHSRREDDHHESKSSPGIRGSDDKSLCVGTEPKKNLAT